MYMNQLSCCGVREICGLGEDQSATKSMESFLVATAPYDGSVMRRDRFRYVIFTSINKSRYGQRFAGHIRANNLGEVTEIGPAVNPNTSNQLTVWVWTVDHDNLKKYREKTATKKPTTGQAPLVIGVANG